jgi:hypothetical protein
MLLWVFAAAGMCGYRECQDMRFCRENMNKTIKTWSLDPKSIVLSERRVKATILSNGSDSGLILLICQLKIGAFHVRFEPVNVDEKDFRFDILKEPRIFEQQVVGDYEVISTVKNDN